MHRYEYLKSLVSCVSYICNLSQSLIRFDSKKGPWAPYLRVSSPPSKKGPDFGRSVVLFPSLVYRQAFENHLTQRARNAPPPCLMRLNEAGL